MIPAGTLKYKLTFYQLTNIQSDSGFITKSKVEILTAKAAKLKLTGDEVVNAKELFLTNKLTFKLRFNKIVNENMLVEYNGDEYKIILFDVDAFDNSIKLTIVENNQ